MPIDSETFLPDLIICASGKEAISRPAPSVTVREEFPSALKLTVNR
jgi:hypothetical protein